MIRQLCTLFRCLILDDDIRVEFGKAHDHAKMIAVEVLASLTVLLKSIKFKLKPLYPFTYVLFFSEFSEHSSLQAELILTIASLTVRNEYCLLVEDAGGLKLILESMVTFFITFYSC